MVESEIFCAKNFPAVLASIFVTTVNVFPGKFDSCNVVPMNITFQPQYRWYLKFIVSRVNHDFFTWVEFEDFNLVLKPEKKCALPRNKFDGLIT